jgi:pimeloyl-ACP methyl ester carboxylesterase
MAVLELPDLSLWYERFGATGEAPRLLVFNGSGATIETSKPLLDQLAQHFDVLVHDQRCLGRTGLPASQPTMADYAADAAALVDHVGWDRFAVFGISFGGMVAQEFAVRHAARITRLALLCTSPGGAGGSSYPLHTLADLPAAEREAISLRNLDRRYDDAFLAEHPFDRMIVDGMRARANEVKSDERVRGERMQLEARRRHDVWDRLHLVTCPTLVACGAYDGTAPPENSEAIHSRIAGSELRRYEGGHLFVYQDRRAMPEIVEYLTS